MKMFKNYIVITVVTLLMSEVVRSQGGNVDMANSQPNIPIDNDHNKEADNIIITNNEEP